jgi:hypothetical protein
MTGELDGKPFIPTIVGQSYFSDLGFGDTGLVWLGIASSDTGGEFKKATAQFLNGDRQDAGWLYFILKPGTYYLAMVNSIGGAVTDLPLKFLHAPRVQIEVLADTAVVHIGTMYLRCSGRKGLLGDWRSIACEARVGVQNEEELAQQVASAHLSHLGSPRTVLMQPPDSQTIIFRTPEHK